jgi:carboxyl-terminal processing protease
LRARSLDFKDGLLIWRLPQFTPHNVETLVKDLRGKKSLILDLRGNGGGRVSSLQELLGNFFRDTVPIGTMVDRRGSHSLSAKGSGSRAFTGELIVLVDAGSASAAEIFARTIQLRGRGRVIGDRTAGAVVTSRLYPHEIGGAVVITYATNVAVADMLMTDGGRLEGVGMTPDLVLRPSGADLAAHRDPVLTEAARLFHHVLAPKDIRWFRQRQ